MPIENKEMFIAASSAEYVYIGQGRHLQQLRIAERHNCSMDRTKHTG
jgi:hypothetical protein